MQPWMNYSTNNMYQQPMYQSIQNPYMDNRLANLQQYQQNLQPTQMSGANQGVFTRIVDNFESITANDVPMQGGAFFVKSDGSLVEYRKWNPNGTIETTSYLAQKSNLDSNRVNSLTEEEKTLYGANKEVLEGILNKVDLLSDKVDEILRQKTNSRAKKEVVADE